MENTFVRFLCTLLFLLVGIRSVGQGKISFSLHNWLVDEYLVLADERYGDKIGREGVSILDHEKDPWGDYFLTRVGHDNMYIKSNFAEQPAYVSFATKGGDKLLVSSSPKFSNSFEFSVGTGDSTVVYNLVPQTLYWYRVLSNNIIIKEGVIKTLGHLRMIRVEDVLNIRDLGGWTCTNGSHIAYGKLFRGGTLDGIHDGSSMYVAPNNRKKISTADAQMLANRVGIKAEIDLRGASYKMSNSLIPGATYKNYPVMNYENFLDDANYYSNIRGALSTIVSNLKDNKPTYFHCEWGADRTGSLAMIIGAICGVCEEDLVKDWELTSFSNHLDFKIISDKTGSKMRKMFTNLYNNYDGKNKSLQDQVIKWLKTKVYSGVSGVDDIINTLQSKLVVNTKSPILVCDWSNNNQIFKYSVITDEQKTEPSQKDKYYLTDGKSKTSDMFCATDYIDCNGYTQVLVNIKTNLIAVCYDAEKKKIGTISTSLAEGSVIMENAEYKLPSGTKYVRFNMPKYCGWNAVLSNQTYL